MNNNITKQLLLSNNYWVINKDLVQLLGIEATFLLSNFAEAEQIMLYKDGWFYQTSETVEKVTTLTRYRQDNAIKKLVEMNILEQANKGMPMKRYFKINYDVLTTKFVRNQQPRLLEISNQGCKKTATSKERINKERINKEKHSCKSDEKEKDLKDFIDYWNDFNITQHTYDNKAIKKAIKRIRNKQHLKEIKKSISRYATAYKDKNHYYRYKWTLDKFIIQGNGYLDWLDEGQRWVSYIAENPTVTDKPKTKKEIEEAKKNQEELAKIAKNLFKE